VHLALLERHLARQQLFEVYHGPLSFLTESRQKMKAPGAAGLAKHVPGHDPPERN
jgi:hypothetical protein